MVGKRAENVIEIRAYIKGRSLLGLKPVDIHCEVCDIYWKGQMSYMTICRWVARFKSGHQQLKDAAHTGRPATTTTKHNIELIRQILEKDARYTVRQLAKMTGLSLARIHCILKKHLKLGKINARWIPHLLTDDQKRSRVDKAKSLLKKYPKYSKKAFDNLVTGDETWVYFFEPKRKCSNRIWATQNAKRPSIAKRIRTVRKVLYVIFFDNKGPIIQIPVPKGKTVTAKYYRDVVLRKLKKVYKRRRPQTGLKYLRLLHDNAPAHKARIVTEFLKAENVTVLPHPAYSPDLAPCDFLLFPKLKFHLSGTKYKSRNALGSAIYQYLMSIPIQEYEHCFQKWIDRLKRCINAEGEYFEGQGKVK